MKVEKQIREIIEFYCGGTYENRNTATKEILQICQALQLQQTGVSTCFLEDCEDHFFEIKYKQVSCCKIAPITNENYCPNCGNKILK